MVDFGHAKQIFEEADVFPSIIVVIRPPSSETRSRVCTIPREQLRIDDLSRQIEREGVELRLSQLAGDAWQLEPVGVNALLGKIRGGGAVVEFSGAKPFRGSRRAITKPSSSTRRPRSLRKGRSEIEADPQALLAGAGLRPWSARLGRFLDDRSQVQRQPHGPGRLAIPRPRNIRADIPPPILSHEVSFEEV